MFVETRIREFGAYLQYILKGSTEGQQMESYNTILLLWKAHWRRDHFQDSLDKKAYDWSWQEKKSTQLKEVSHQVEKGPA